MNFLTPLVFIWNSIFYHPVVNLILFLYKNTGENLGVAIILLTILIRLILWPLMKSQISAVKNMQAMKPKVDALKEKYKNDKKKFQEEQLKLYRENGVNPAGSCLPLVIQLPFLYAMYNVIRTIALSKNAAVFNNIVYSDALKLSSHTHFNTHFLGLDLAKDAAMIGFHNIGAVLPYLVIALLVGVTQYFASKVSLPANKAEITETVEIIEEPSIKSSEKKSKKKKNMPVQSVAETKKKNTETLDPEQFSQTLSTQMLYIFPVILTWISLGFSGSIPSGLSIYWIVQSVFLVLQTLILQDKLPWKLKK